MASILAYITGVLISTMIYFNSALGQQTSPILSNILFHSFGLTAFAIVCWIRRKKEAPLTFKWKYLIPGALGSLTVMMNNWIVFEVGVSLMVALGLLGQMIASACIDGFGLLGRKRIKINGNQWFGIGIICVGLIVMVL